MNYTQTYVYGFAGSLPWSFLEFLRALYHVVTSAAYIPTLTHRELRGIS